MYVVIPNSFHYDLLATCGVAHVYFLSTHHISPHMHALVVPMLTQWGVMSKLMIHGGLNLRLLTLNLSPPGQNGHHFADDILKCIFLNENV